MTESWHMSNKFKKLEHNHIAYNAQRTLRTKTESQFKIDNFGSLQLLSDANIAFANQIWGIDEQSIKYLPEAMQIYDNLSMSPELDITDKNLTKKLRENLKKMGFKQIEILNFLVHKEEDFATISPEIEVERLQNEDADTLLKLLKISGMQTTEDIWQLKKHLYCTDLFRCYVAKIDGVVRALATTYVDGQFGLLANAYTQEAFQNQGCQTALIQARISDAKHLGLTDLIVDVLPNTSSESNCLKAGFKPLNTRYIWQKDTD